MPRAAIAFGSNLGDRAGYIAQALRSVGRFCTVQRTSSLYESPPAYVTEQPPDGGPALGEESLSKTGRRISFLQSEEKGAPTTGVSAPPPRNQTRA